MQNPRNSNEIRAWLSQVASGYGDGLRAGTRRAVIQGALMRPVGRLEGFLAGARLAGPRLLAAAAMALVLVLPALQINRGLTKAPAKSDISDLAVTTDGGRVVLTWTDGDQPHRVVRATSREELARLAAMPGEVVTGERWVDRTDDGAEIVFYLVD